MPHYNLGRNLVSTQVLLLVRHSYSFVSSSILSYQLAFGGIIWTEGGASRAATAWLNSSCEIDTTECNLVSICSSTSTSSLAPCSPLKAPRLLSTPVTRSLIPALNLSLSETGILTETVETTIAYQNETAKNERANRAIKKWKRKSPRENRLGATQRGHKERTTS